MGLFRNGPRLHSTDTLCVPVCDPAGVTRHKMGFESVCLHEGRGNRPCCPSQLVPEIPEPTLELCESTKSH